MMLCKGKAWAHPRRGFGPWCDGRCHWPAWASLAQASAATTVDVARAAPSSQHPSPALFRCWPALFGSLPLAPDRPSRLLAAAARARLSNLRTPAVHSRAAAAHHPPVTTSSPCHGTKLERRGLSCAPSTGPESPRVWLESGVNATPIIRCHSGFAAFNACQWLSAAHLEPIR